MENSVVKKFLQNVDVDVKTASSIRVTVNKGDSTEFNQNIRVKSTNGTKTVTFVKCVSDNALVNGFGGTPGVVTDMGANNGYIYMQNKSGVTYPALVTLDIYPKYNLEDVTVNRISDVDKYMSNLKILFQDGVPFVDYEFDQIYTENINVLSDVTSLEKISLYGGETINGNVADLKKLVNLKYLHGHTAQIYGDLKDLLDGMYANGRTSGEFIFGSSCTKLVLTYNGTTTRIQGADIYQAQSCWGWRFVFSSNGWSVAETYENYADIPTIDSVS